MKSFTAVRVAIFLTTAFIVQTSVLAETEYPAAYFEPYIVYQAPEVVGNAPAESEAGASEQAEENPYPAAYYQPVIVFQDKELIAAKEKQKAAKPKPAPAQKAKPSPAVSAPPPVTDEGGFPMTVLVLLIAVIGALYWVMTKDKGAGAEAEPVDAESSENEETEAEESADEAGEEATPEA